MLGNWFFHMLELWRWSSIVPPSDFLLYCCVAGNLVSGFSSVAEGKSKFTSSTWRLAFTLMKSQDILRLTVWTPTSCLKNTLILCFFTDIPWSRNALPCHLAEIFWHTRLIILRKFFLLFYLFKRIRNTFIVLNVSSFLVHLLCQHDLKSWWP